MGTPVSGGLVKNAGAIGWSDVDTAEAALIERCTTGDEAACADLVNTHQRMVYTLALHLLQDPDEAWTCRRRYSCASSAPSRVSAVNPRSRPGSTGSSSTRRGTASGGGGG